MFRYGARKKHRHLMRKLQAQPRGRHDHNNVLYKRYKAMQCTIVDRLDVNIAHGALKGFYASQNHIPSMS